MQPDTDTRDTNVWGELQGTLFASIVICRLLRPGKVNPYPRDTQHLRQAEADRRAEKLAEVLHIADDFAIFNVREVRNRFEHFDERLDSAVLADRTSLVDWHISRDGTSFRTPQGYGGPLVESLRVFYPLGGTLHFGEQLLDLYALDVALINLRDELAPQARNELNALISDAKHYGASQYIQLIPIETAKERMKRWLEIREESGSPIPYNP